MREILEAQKKHLTETVDKHQNIDQLHLFNPRGAASVGLEPALLGEAPGRT